MKKSIHERLFPYSISEDIANSISHGLAALVFGILNVYLIYSASISGSITAVVTYSIYGYTVMLMFLMSCLYHGIRHIVARDVFKRLDHSFIFLTILASYAPIVFVGLQTTASYITFAVLSIMTILGIIFKSIFSDKYHKVVTILFILMGWSAVALIPQLFGTMSTMFLVWLFIGGIMYTVGALFYAVLKFKFNHFVWHLFVIFGAAAHYVAVLLYL